MTSPRNVPASVRQRLLNRARSDRRPFNELLQYFAMERFLYRLSQSAHADRFVLKGALMLRVWQSPEPRPTMDIDLLGRTRTEEAGVLAQVRDILSVDVEADGLAFNPASIRTERITEGADYEGIRTRFQGALGTARIHMQIDIGFGDVVYPEPEASTLPTMLDFPAPRLLCYSRESAIAGKARSYGQAGHAEQPDEGLLRHLVAVSAVRFQRTRAGPGHTADFRAARHRATHGIGGLHPVLRR